MMNEKRMRLRYAGTCRICSAHLEARTDAIYERATRTVRCVSHDALPSPTDTSARVDPGTPGASARREYDRRSARRAERIRTKYPRLSGLILALSDDPQSTRSWDTGASGEEALGERLNELASDRLRVLHDRRIPGSRANIDHLAVTPTGVWVIDPKKYKGRPQLKIEGGLIRPRVEKLFVGTRDRTKLVAGMHRQISVVRSVVGEDVPVHGVLCFIESDWPLLGGAFAVGDIKVMRPKKLYPLLHEDGPLATDRIDHLHRALAARLTAA